MTRTRKIRSHFEGIYLRPPYYLIVKVETTSPSTAGIFKNRFLWKIIVILPLSPLVDIVLSFPVTKEVPKPYDFS